MNKATEILTRAEEALRSLIAEHVREGEYDDVAEVTHLARAIGEMRERLASSQGPHSISSKPEHGRDSTPRKRSGKARRRSSSRRSEYPKFQISGEKLVRIGWSKKEKAPYEHRTPRAIFDSVVKALAEVTAAARGPHASDSIIECANKGATEPIPDYQVYSVIGFLKESGAIAKKGRSGYEVPKGISTRASQAWDEAADDK